MRGLLVAAAVAAVSAFAAPANAALHLEPVGTFDSPVFVTGDPTNADRLMVVEKDGRIIASGKEGTGTFLDIHTLVSNCSERGLLSMAFPPDYATTHLFYVLYNRSATPDPALEGDLQIDEFQTQNGAVVMSSQRHVLTIDHPDCQHNGGQMQFGPDHDLYISTGDGGDGTVAQDTGSLLGKVLRIWPRPGITTQYTIPVGNPFRGSTPGSDEIWSYGLRNPWRFSFDRLTGDLIIGDVGDSNWEEIDYEPAPNGGQGDNFGWETCEGLFFHGTSTPCNVGTLPVYEYPHTNGRCAITGGYVARDTSLGDVYGRYLFADLCTGQVYSARLAVPTTSDVRTEPVVVDGPSTFGEDACGRLYIAEIGGAVSRFVGSTPADCPTTNPGGDPGGGDPGGDPGGGGDSGGGDPGGSDQPTASCGGEAVTQAVPETGGRVDGTEGPDVLVGSSEADRIVGHGGHDVICAGGGDDIVKAGAGKDDLRGGGGADKLDAGAGADWCKGGAGVDRLISC